MRQDTAEVSLISRRTPEYIGLTIRGELDITTTAGLRDQIARIVDDAAVPVIVDLSGVSCCDASGLAMLVGAQRRARLRGLTVAISEPGREVSGLLRTSGLGHALATYPTLAAACHGLRRSDHPAVA
jgi:anti-anti-sigma factor